MSDKRVDELFEAQRGVAAVWQMREAGCSRGVIRHAVKPMRAVHDGVYLSGHAPATDWQLWKAATITAPGTLLADWSASSLNTIREKADRMPTTVIRPGDGSTLRIPAKEGFLGSLNVRRVKVHPSEIVVIDDIASISVARNTLDLIARVGTEPADRFMRDVLRKQLATLVELRACLALHHGDRGVARMKALLDHYGPLPLNRSKSDAEALGLGLLAAAGFEIPAHNVFVAGEEADFAWFGLKHITEIDGPQYHQFPERDAKKERAWRSEGWTVSRVPTDDVYDSPHRLLAAATPPPFGPR